MVDGFLGIGYWEIILVFIIILLVLGPKRLPVIAGRLGTIVRHLKRATSDFSTALTKEVEGTPLKQDENPLDGLRMAAIDFKSSLTGKGEDAPRNEDENT